MLRYFEHDRFAVPSCTFDSNLPLVENCGTWSIGIESRAEGPALSIMDRRREVPCGKLLIPPPNGWVSVRCNARCVDFDTGHWYYEQRTVHLAVRDCFDPAVFIASPPNEFLDLRIRLR